MSLRKLATLLGLRAHSGLVDYERDYRVPSVDLLREYQRVLHADGDQLLRLRREAIRNRQSRQVVALVPVRSGAEPPIRVVSGAAPDVVREAAQRARTFAQDAPAPLDDELVEQILDETRTLARAYPRRPSTGLLGDLVAAQEQLLALLGRNHAPASARRLYWVAAVLSGTLARASLDFGDPAAATTQAHAAFVCADRGGHDGLRGWVRGMQSSIACWDGQPHKAVRYAQHGSALAQGTTGSVTAWLPACEAKAWAELGDAERALRCVARAEAAWDTVVPDDLDAVGGTCRCGRAQLCYLIADALSRLPDRTDDVDEYCRQATAGYRDELAPDWDFGASACVAGLTALNLARRGAGERACDILAPLLATAADARLFTVRHTVSRIAECPGAAGLRELVRRFACDA